MTIELVLGIDVLEYGVLSYWIALAYWRSYLGIYGGCTVV